MTRVRAMYMIAFVTLMVTLIGAYAQIYTSQAVKGMSQQSGVVNEMLAWHGTAVALASKLAANITTTGCLLTKLSGTTGFPSLPICANPSNPSIYVGMAVGANNACSGNTATGIAPCVTLPPNGYINYNFYSVAYQSAAGVDYVLTYVPQPPSTSDNYGLGLLCLPGNANGALANCTTSPHTQFPMTFNSLYKQLQQSSLISPFNYGIVTALGLTTPTLNTLFTPSLTAITYPAPATTYVPVGSIGIITQVTPCPAGTCI